MSYEDTLIPVLVLFLLEILLWGGCELSDDIGTMLCADKGLTKVPEFNGTLRFDRLRLARNRITRIETTTFVNLGFLDDLSLQGNAISAIEHGAFQELPKLQHLDLSANQLTRLTAGTFRGLSSLQVLFLNQNNITYIEPGTFREQSTLFVLDLGENRLTLLSAGTFQGLSSLYILHLIHNNLSILGDRSFDGLNEPQQIDIRFNQIEKIELLALRNFYKNVTLYSDDWRVCCITIASGLRCKTVISDDSILMDIIFPTIQITIFSSCEDLMHNLFLRSFVWILGVFSVGFNIGVISWRLLSRYRHRRQGPNWHHRKSSLLAACLAFGDLCMGCFLLIIATADHHYRGYYILQDENWRNSFWCPLAGFLSAFSSEFSVFILTVITVDRYLAILHPTSDRVLNYFRTKITIAFTLILSVVLAGIPLATSSLSDLYNQTGVCLALPLSVAVEGASNTTVAQEGTPSWIYSFSVFIGLNTISVLTIIFCYARIFWEAIKSNRKTTNTTRNIETRMGGRIMLVVSTDMACWLPIIVLGFLSALGYQLPPTVYAWIAVFVLPINSAINPLIYTFYTAAFQKAICRKCVKVTGSQHRYLKAGWRDQDSFRSSYRSRRDDIIEMEIYTQDAPMSKASTLREVS